MVSRTCVGCSAAGVSDGPEVCATATDGEADDTIAIVTAATMARQRTLEKISVIVKGKKRDCVQRSTVRLSERAFGRRQRMEIEMGQLPENFLVVLVTEERHSTTFGAPDAVHNG